MAFTTRLLRIVAWIGLPFGAAACERGNSGDPLTPPPSHAIVLTSPDTALQVPRGWNAFVALNVARTAAVTGSIALQIDSVPSGMVALFDTPTLASTLSTTRLMVDVDSLIAPGDYTFIVRASAAGVTRSSLRVRVTVPRPSFGLVVSSTGLSLTQALPIAGTLRLASLVRRNGFRGDITLTFHGLPRDISPSTFLLREGARYPSEVAFVGSARPPWPEVGSGTITIHATARDAFEQLITLPLSVAPAPPALTIGAQPKAIVIARGDAGRVVLQVSVRPGLLKIVEDFWVAGLPAGVSATTDEADTGYASLDLRVASQVVPGTYPLAVHGRLAGTAPGVSDGSVALSLIVR